jgi:hypothetical protein
MADAADGSFPSTAVTAKFNGELLMFITDPQAVAPTVNYDIVLTNQYGADVLGGSAANRSDTATETAVPVIGTYFRPYTAKGDTLTLAISNNSVNSAGIVATLYYRYLGS